MEELIRRLQKALQKCDRFETEPGHHIPGGIPEDLAEFYRVADPVSVSVQWILGELIIPRHQKLADAQIGYAVDGHDGSHLQGWPSGQTVIATSSQAPIFTDLSDDSPIYYAVHGIGQWHPRKVADTMIELLTMVTIWKEIEKSRSGNIHEDDFEILPEVLSEFETLSVKSGVDAACVDVVLSNR